MPLILIVDDSPTELHVMQKALEKVGYRTAAAVDGAEGVRLARDQVQVPGHAQRDAHPLAAGARLGVRARGHRAPAPLELGEQIEGPVAQRLELELG